MVKRQKPITLPDTATVQTACRKMRDERIGAILVTSNDGRLTGMVTGRDVVGRVVAEALDPTTTLLGSVMTLEPDVIRPTDRASDALHMMQSRGYRHLPVMDGRQIVGIVSRGDFTGSDFPGEEHTRLDEETGFLEIN
jgi:CBS domain-containing protein